MERVRHTRWWVSDSVDWRRVGDSVQGTLSALRAKPLESREVLRQNGAWDRRYFMRGYEVKYVEYRWPMRSDSSRRGRARFGIEVDGGSGVPSCEAPARRTRFLSVREMEVMVGRRIAEVLGLQSRAIREGRPRAGVRAGGGCLKNGSTRQAWRAGRPARRLIE